MEINLDDTKPVQKSHLAVPKQFYGEVKAYIEDLLKKSLSDSPSQLGLHQLYV